MTKYLRSYKHHVCLKASAEIFVICQATPGSPEPLTPAMGSSGTLLLSRLLKALKLSARHVLPFARWGEALKVGVINHVQVHP